MPRLSSELTHKPSGKRSGCNFLTYVSIYMEAERINFINNLCDDLAHRLAELRGYL